MIHINLLPGANKKTTSSKKSVNLSGFRFGFSGAFKDRFFIVASAVVVLTLGAVGYMYLSQGVRTAEDW